MSTKTYMVSVSTETAERLQGVADHQNISLEVALQQAVADYTNTWEEHMHDMAADETDNDRDHLPWLKSD